MATIHDVARVADVSIATVSRVLNGSGHVSAETRQRVGAAAAALNYWPNGAARSLSTRRTHALGVLLPDLYGEFRLVTRFPEPPERSWPRFISWMARPTLRDVVLFRFATAHRERTVEALSGTRRSSFRAESRRIATSSQFQRLQTASKNSPFRFSYCR